VSCKAEFERQSRTFTAKESMILFLDGVNALEREENYAEN
jgi:hypothetical protein